MACEPTNAEAEARSWYNSVFSASHPMRSTGAHPIGFGAGRTLVRVGLSSKSQEAPGTRRSLGYPTYVKECVAQRRLDTPEFATM